MLVCRHQETQRHKPFLHRSEGPRGPSVCVGAGGAVERSLCLTVPLRQRQNHPLVENLIHLSRWKVIRFKVLYNDQVIVTTTTYQQTALP